MAGLIPQIPLFPLAQMNTNTGGAPASNAAAPAATGPAAAPAAPVAQAGAGTQGGTASGPATATGTAPAGTQSAPQQNGSFPWQFLLIIGMLVLLYVFMSRGQRKDEKKRKAMIQELKKGDQVVTIGGMVARVVSIDGDEVVLKIDESANVKGSFRKYAIHEVLPDRDKK